MSKKIKPLLKPNYIPFLSPIVGLLWIGLSIAHAMKGEQELYNLKGFDWFLSIMNLLGIGLETPDDSWVGEFGVVLVRLYQALTWWVALPILELFKGPYMVAFILISGYIITQMLWGSAQSVVSRVEPECCGSRFIGYNAGYILFLLLIITFPYKWLHFGVWIIIIAILVTWGVYDGLSNQNALRYDIHIRYTTNGLVCAALFFQVSEKLPYPFQWYTLFFIVIWILFIVLADQYYSYYYNREIGQCYDRNGNIVNPNLCPEFRDWL